jgi:hypothetical protein
MMDFLFVVSSYQRMSNVHFSSTSMCTLDISLGTKDMLERLANFSNSCQWGIRQSNGASSAKVKRMYSLIFVLHVYHRGKWQLYLCCNMFIKSATNVLVSEF